MESAKRSPSLLLLSRYWLRIGFVSWGGMWTVIPGIKADFAEREWVPGEDFDMIMAAATLVPGPTFVSLAGLMGYRVRGAWGSLVSAVALMVPSAVLVSAAMIFLSSARFAGPMAHITRMLTVAMSGVVIGNAWIIMRSAPRRAAGVLLMLATGVAILLGAPVVWTVVVSVLVGRLLLGGEPA